MTPLCILYTLYTQSFIVTYFLEIMCREAGIAQNTNHSLRATGASALFHAGVLERLIRDVTGHKAHALHLYERPTEQEKQVSAVLVHGEE